jgi:hypothetical protein
MGQGVQSLDFVRNPPLTVETGLLVNTPTGNTDLFSITGTVHLISIIGVVKTTAMAAAQTRLKLTATADALVATDLCTALDCTGHTVGTTYNTTGTLADAMVASTNGVAIAAAKKAVIACITSAVITLNNADAANAGQTFWSVLYEPIHPGAKILPLL